MRAIAALAATTVAALLLSPAAHALDTPTDRVVLTVTGAIDTTNNGPEAVFDLSMLRALPGRVGEMETPWIEGKTRFGGPLLQAVLDTVGARGKTLRITALNDYSAEIPATDASDFQTILAIEMNGQPMSVRDKGPIFMIYPFDTEPQLYNEKYFARSVWQIKTIEVVE